MELYRPQARVYLEIEFNSIRKSNGRNTFRDRPIAARSCGYYCRELQRGAVDSAYHVGVIKRQGAPDISLAKK
jgi:hypothetical protein